MSATILSFLLGFLADVVSKIFNQWRTDQQNRRDGARELALEQAQRERLWQKEVVVLQQDIASDDNLHDVLKRLSDNKTDARH